MADHPLFHTDHLQDFQDFFMDYEYSDRLLQDCEEDLACSECVEDCACATGFSCVNKGLLAFIIVFCIALVFGLAFFALFKYVRRRDKRKRMMAGGVTVGNPDTSQVNYINNSSSIQMAERPINDGYQSPKSQHYDNDAMPMGASKFRDFSRENIEPDQSFTHTPMHHSPQGTSVYASNQRRAPRPEDFGLKEQEVLTDCVLTNGYKLTKSDKFYTPGNQSMRSYQSAPPVQNHIQSYAKTSRPYHDDHEVVQEYVNAYGQAYSKMNYQNMGAPPIVLKSFERAQMDDYH